MVCVWTIAWLLSHSSASHNALFIKVTKSVQSSFTGHVDCRAHLERYPMVSYTSDVKHLWCTGFWTWARRERSTKNHKESGDSCREEYVFHSGWSIDFLSELKFGRWAESRLQSLDYKVVLNKLCFIWRKVTCCLILQTMNKIDKWLSYRHVWTCQCIRA